MKLRFIGTTSQGSGCPSLYETDGGDFVVQGRRLTDPEALAQVKNVLEGEEFVVVPRELLTRYTPKE
ncbi:hypothetical protein O4J56_09250 [Nocardiopsis sp. RSe5-2]|uniref:Uncharacterized protein n=1 Tax=Nocardiopsis endophytica TaxID=3018445 RepID=A0ABT4U1K7_9ACTN|nr:hypothetical protein [Nocardiopsis endophytica]MDA2810818.1 hypothetical protein [Nocardiopsis endophytica]